MFLKLNSDISYILIEKSIYDYTFEIDDNNQKLLNLNDANDLLTFNIVNIPLNRPEDATINLLAPIVVNIKENIGAQLILSGSNHLPNKRLFET